MDTSPPSSGRLPEPAAADDPRLQALARLLGVVDRLRAPDGCPWDRKQTLASMAPHVLEEAHELSDAIEDGEQPAIAEEAGDVLMNVALVCRIAQDGGRFDLADVAGGVADKLVRRHPHVFGEVRAEDADQALASWEAAKRGERADSERADASALAGIPRGLPALQRAARVSAKAAAAGFRWASPAGALHQLGAELEELRVELDPHLGGDGGAQRLEGEPARRAGEELGDVLFAAACLGTYLGLDPEAACRAASKRFERRFRALETGLDRPLAEVPLEQLLERWRATPR